MKTETKSLIAGYVIVAIIAFWCTSLVKSIMRSEFQATYYQSGVITASGEKFDPNAMACAHPYATFGSWVKVESSDTEPANVIYVRVNDRTKTAQLIDLTPAAFKQLAPLERGKIKVRVTQAR